MLKIPINKLEDNVEYIVQSDSAGNIIGPISRTYAHSKNIRSNLTHHSTWAMIYHPKSNKYGIQLKNPKKHDRYSAGKWDMSVAGHNCYVKKGKFFKPLDFNENLIKEAQEEVGINLKMYNTKIAFLKAARQLKNSQPIGFIFDKFHYQTKINNEWVGLGLIITPTTETRFNDREVVDFKWLSPDELKMFILKETNYCEPLPLVFYKVEEFRKQNLSE